MRRALPVRSQAGQARVNVRGLGSAWFGVVLVVLGLVASASTVWRMLVLRLPEPPLAVLTRHRMLGPWASNSPYCSRSLR